VVVGLGGTVVAGSTPPPGTVVVVTATGGTVVVGTGPAGGRIVVVAGGSVVDEGSTPPQGIEVVVEEGTVVGMGTVVAGGTVVDGGTVVRTTPEQGAVVVVVGSVPGGSVVGTMGAGTVVVVAVVVVVGGVVVVVGGTVVGGTVVGGTVVVVGARVVGVVVGVAGVTWLVKVASVTPVPMRTDTVAPLVLAPPTSRSAGATAMADTWTPRGTTSETATFVATGNEPATTQYPPGAGPAGTDTGTVPTAKVKSAPTATPVPATLQILSGASSARLVNVTVVCADTSPATTVTWATRPAKSLLTSRSAGDVRMSLTDVPSTRTSVIVAGPAGSAMAAEQAPTGTVTVRPPTVKSKSPVTAGPSACLQISRKPAGPPWAASTTTGTPTRNSDRAAPAANDHGLLWCNRFKSPSLRDIPPLRSPAGSAASAFGPVGRILPGPTADCKYQRLWKNPRQLAESVDEGLTTDRSKQPHRTRHGRS
jgi:hypothetical protein